MEMLIAALIILAGLIFYAGFEYRKIHHHSIVA